MGNPEDGRTAIELPEGVTPETVRAELAGILEAKEFAQSERMRRFLHFVVDRTLSGDRDALKEYTIGVEVFDRPASYDPRIDSIVRVEARRLRRKLRGYYERSGPAHRVRFTLPEGSYAPVFELPGNGSSAEESAAKAEAAKPDVNAIAVLPFVNLTPDKENEYFADGLTEELITTLAQAPPLRVVSRSSAFQFKNQTYDVRAIGEKLGVSRVLEGSVRRAGDSLRVTAQLVNVADGLQVWSERFDRRMEDIFALQEEIAGAIAGVMRVRVAALTGTHPGDQAVPGAAIRHLLEGRHFLSRVTPSSLRSALQCFQRSVREDPTFSYAHAALASCYLQMSMFGDVSGVSVAPQARASIAEALKHNPENAWAYTCRAMLRSAIEWDFAAAEEDYRTSIRIHAGGPDNHYFYAASLLTPLGRFDEALEQLHLALTVDPSSLITNTGIAIAHYLRGDNESALNQFEHTLSLNPAYYGAHRMMSYALIRQGDCAEAVKLLEAAQSLAEGDPRMMAALGYAYGRCGRKKQAVAIAEYLESSSKERFVSAYDRAMVRLGLGGTDEAARLLLEAVNEQECWLIYINTDPAFEPLAGNESFERLRRMIFKPEKSKSIPT